MKMLMGADVHLRPETWARLPSVRGDAYHSLQQLPELAEQYGAAVIVLLGDVFDSANPDALSVTELRTCVARAAAKRIAVIMSQGNHDQVLVRPINPDSEIAWADAVGALSNRGQIIELGGGHKGIYLDFVPSGKLQQVLATIPGDVDVLFAHQSWAEVQRVGHADGNAAMLPPNIRWVFTGDNHTHGAFYGSNAGGTVTFFSPGSMSMQAMNEEPVKYVFLVDFDHPEPRVDRLQLATRPFYRQKFATPAEFEAFLASPVRAVGKTANIEPVCDTPLYHFDVPNTVPGAKERLRAVLGSCHLDVEVFAPAIEEVVIDYEHAAQLGGFETLPSAIRELADRGGVDPQIAEDCVRLVSSVNPAAELAALRSEFLERRRALANRAV